MAKDPISLHRKLGGKIFVDKIEDKYRFYWNDDDLI